VATIYFGVGKLAVGGDLPCVWFS